MRQCQICAENLEHDPNPIFQLNSSATILIAGQAPGRKVHESNSPFNDPSGKRLRNWMSISEDDFYDDSKIAILPMGFCYPGQGKSGDLPPRKECAATWREKVLNFLPNIQLSILIGNYAIEWHLANSKQNNLTETVKAWNLYAPEVIPLPHPSPRNNIWLKKNNWFEKEVIPQLRSRIRLIMTK